MKIRDAIDTDLDVITQSFMNRLWEAGKDMEGDRVKADITELMDDPARGMYLIAEDDEEFVGCMSVLRSDDEEHGEVFQSQWVYIQPEYRKTGVEQKMNEYFADKRKI